MSSLAAALVRPQLALLPARVRDLNVRYEQLAGLLRAVPGIRVPERHEKEQFVGSSIQFNLDHNDFASVVETAAAHGVFCERHRFAGDAHVNALGWAQHARLDHG